MNKRALIQWGGKLCVFVCLLSVAGQLGLVDGILFAQTQSSGPEIPARIRIGANIQSAKLENRIEPVYPPLAKQARIQGTVRLQVIIGKDGSAQQLEVISGHPLLAQPALDAVRQWRYQPTLLNGQPVEVVTTVDVMFTLGDSPGTVSGAETARRTTPAEREAAIAERRAAVEKEPNDAAAHYELARLLGSTPNVAAEAIEHFREALRLKPEDSTIAGDYAQALQLRGDVKGALSVLRDAIANHPTDAALRVRLGDVLRLSLAWPEAIAAYREATISQVDHTDSYLRLGTTLYQTRPAEKASKELRDALSAYPDPFAFHMRLAGLLQVYVAVRAAQAEVGEALRINENDESATKQRDGLLQKREEEDRRMTEVRRQILEKPESRESRTSLASWLLQIADLDAAITEYRILARLNPDVTNSFRGLAEAVARKGGREHAVSELRDWVKQLPNALGPRMALGQVLERTGEVEAAEKEYQEAMRIRPEAGEPHRALGNLFRRRGEEQNARAEFDQADAIDEAAGATSPEANEGAAVAALRVLNTTNVTYSATYGGFAPELKSLGPPSGADSKPSAIAADLIDMRLASGTKRGYVFTYMVGRDEKGAVVGYTINADPITPGVTGLRSFFTDQSGVIRSSRSGRASAESAPI